ncbi:NAD(P)-dependent oxidoreductase [Nakamurella sp. GG22]
MTAASRRVGFIGLGNMGIPMARHLLAAGHQVAGYDPSSTAQQRAAETGIGIIREFTAITDHADVIILMLPNSSVVEKVLIQDGLLSRMSTGGTVIDMGSSKPASTRTLAAVAAKDGIDYVDAPVSGGVVGAEAATLTIMIGGVPGAVAKIHDLLSTLGSRVTHLGPAGAGHALKALNNLMSATHLLVSSEALLVGQEFGLDVNVMLDAINTSSGRSGSTEVKWPKYVVPGSFDSGFGLSLMLKDMRIAVELAKDSGIPSRLGEAAVALWSEAENALPPGSDHTRIVTWLEGRPAQVISDL